VLWYPDDVSCLEHAQRDVRTFGYAYDIVYSFDPATLPIFKAFGVQNPRCLPVAADPNVYRKLEGTEKVHDVSFIGNLYPNRVKLLERLSKRFSVFVAQAYMDDMVKIFNESKIVLNLGVGQTGIQLRVFEAMACGSFVLTNEIPADGRLFKDKHHLVYFNDENIEDLIDYYLKHDDEREFIAAQGHKEVISRHTFDHRVSTILHDVFDTEQDEEEQDHRQLKDYKIDIRRTDFSPNKPPRKGPKGNLRIFAAFQHFNWENHNLQPALEEFGEVIRYDWSPKYDQYSPSWHIRDKFLMNQELLEKVAIAHAEKRIDIFFGYLSGRLVLPHTVKAIRMMGIPTLNISLDDRDFMGRLELTGYSRMVEIAHAFDLCWTSVEDAIPDYQRVGADPIYLPEGANPKIHRPLDLPKDIDVSFVGQCYGYRPKVIQYLSNHGINVEVFGQGWPNGEISLEKMVEIYNRSKINLGFAGVGTSEIKCLKARDFEVPMSRGLYLTEYHRELENVYEIGKEILCYRTLDELLELINYYLSHPDEAEQIREAGYRRAISEHTWVKRFEVAFEKLGKLV
jgi:spore maturation protein CgeB